MRFRLYWPYATRSLARGGQRTVLALFCIAVGVMAIVALQLVGQSIDNALTGNITEANGGDLRLDTLLIPLAQPELATFDQLKQQGQITDYATIYEIPGSVTLSSGAVEPFAVVAVSPNFPLVGQANFTVPAHNLRVQDVVTGNHIAISTSVADTLGAHLGSAYAIDTGDGRTVTVVVAAEFLDGGLFQGPQVLISQAALDAAPNLSGTPAPPQYSTVMMTASPAAVAPVKATLQQHFGTATVTTVQDELKLRQSDVADIRLFLQIVGLLALFIGGIGIINTMQVLLRRRRVEIAMLKAMGYRRRDLYVLFGLEAALLGLVGSIFGAALGLAASYGVSAVVAQAFFLHLTIAPDLGILLAGLAIGVATALIFGLLPIVQSASVRPLAVLREDEPRRAGASFVTATLVLTLSLLFVGLATAIMGNVVVAVAAIYGGALLIGALAALFGALVLLIARLPVYERPSWRMLWWVLTATLVTAAAVALVLIASRQFGALDLLKPDAGQSALQVAPALVAGGLGLLLAGCAAVYLLATLADGAIMFAPRGWKTAVMLAYRNIGRQRARSITTLTALFVGVFAIALILILGQGIKDAINTTFSTVFTHNLFVLAPPQLAGTARQTVANIPGIDGAKTTVAAVARVRPVTVANRPIATVLGTGDTQPGDQSTGQRETTLLLLSVVEGFDVNSGAASDLPQVKMTVGRNLTPADAGTENAIMNDLLLGTPTSLQLGDTVVVTNQDGTVTRTLHIVGFFNRVRTTDVVFGEILVAAPIAQQLGGKQTLNIISLKADLAQVPAIRQAVTQRIPFAQIVSLTDLNAIIDRILNNLILMLTVIASLSMIAGLIVIANAVTLAMVERRREIGILKSVGHTSRSILAMVLIENGLMGLLGALMALLLVTDLLIALSIFVFKTTIAIGPALAGGIVAATVALVMLVAALVAWRATRVRPLEVLRYE